MLGLLKRTRKEVITEEEVIKKEEPIVFVNGFKIGEKVYHLGVEEIITKFDRPDYVGDVKVYFSSGGTSWTRFVISEEIHKERMAEMAEFNAIKPKCLSCVHRLEYHYIANPHQPDPMFLKCKALNEVFCNEDNWARKVLDCSEYEKMELSLRTGGEDNVCRETSSKS
jgi:hypothetical protein